MPKTLFCLSHAYSKSLKYLRQSSILTQALVSSLSTSPIGQTHLGASHNEGGFGLLHVALKGKQSTVKNCPFPGHSTRECKIT